MTSDSGLTTTNASTIQKSLSRFRTWLSLTGLDEKEHQVTGMEWCLRHELSMKTALSMRGGILADEMGLGKTILMMGCIISNFKPRTLIVVPLSLLKQWCGVVEKFGLGLSSRMILWHGGRIKRISPSQLRQAHIVITTYGMISQRTEYPSMLYDILWNRIIYDEAHHMRNMKTRIFCGAKLLRAQISWLVTGTPLQNRTEDLKALLYLLGYNGRQIATNASLLSILSSRLLRRTKKQVGLHLPEVHQHNIMVDWKSAPEAKLARDIHQHISFVPPTFGNVDAIMNHLSNFVLPMMTRARQLCIYPQLLYMAFRKMQARGLVPDDVPLRQIRTASKLEAVMAVLVSRRNNRRQKLVFSHYRGELDELSRRLKVAGISNAIVDGRSSKKMRELLLSPPLSFTDWSLLSKKHLETPEVIFHKIKTFMIPDVLLVQIQTACEGLNLQHYQEIYFTSPHWNPAVEDQAVARVHRIGQSQPVDVFRFIMQGFGRNSISLDRYCALVQKKKRALTSSIIK